MKTGVHYGIDYTVYRTLPTLCHSEICAMVINATNAIDPNAGFRGQNINEKNILNDMIVEGVDGNSVEYRKEEKEVEGEEEVENEVEEDDEPLPCQQGWRHISTLTRVMPVSTHTHVHASFYKYIAFFSNLQIKKWFIY